MENQNWNLASYVISHKKRFHKVSSLQNQCLDQIITNSCYYAKNSGPSSLNAWKWGQMIRQLPQSLLNQVLNIHMDILHSAEDSFGFENDHGIYSFKDFHNKMGSTLPSYLIEQVWSLLETNLFDFWYILNEEISPFIPNEAFCTRYKSLIRHSENSPMINYLAIVVNSADKSKFKSLLKTIKESNVVLEKLTVFSNDEDADKILQIVAESKCQMKRFVIKPGCFHVKPANLRKFLKSQRKSLEEINFEEIEFIGQWFEGFKKEMCKLMKTICKMEALKSIELNKDWLCGYEDLYMEALASLNSPLECFSMGLDSFSYELLRKILIKNKETLENINAEDWGTELSANELDSLFEIVHEMDSLKRISMEIDSVIDETKSEDEKFHRLKYLNKKGLTIKFTCSQYWPGEDDEETTYDKSVIDAIVQALPNATVDFDHLNMLRIPIHENETLESEPVPNYDNLKSLCIYYQIEEENYNPLNRNTAGFIWNGTWKNLDCLYISDGSSWNSDISHLNWHQTFPSLTSLTLRFRDFSLPYCSFAALLLGSPDLKNLRIEFFVAGNIIQDFDVKDFKKKTRDRVFMLQEVELSSEYHPIIPFESLLDLMKSCPDLKKLKATFREEDEHQLIRHFCLENENEKKFNLTDFPKFMDMFETETYNVIETAIPLTFLQRLRHLRKSLRFRREL